MNRFQDTRKKRGYLSEAVVQSYLRSNQYRICETNFHARIGEVDIIAWTPEDVLAFVEVKTSRSFSSFDPRHIITAKKKKRMIYVANYYLGRNQLSDVQVRFDLILVSGEQVVEHLENIFLATD